MTTMMLTIFLYLVLAVCATIVFVACFSGVASDDPRKKHEGLKLRRRNNGGETESVSSSASPTEEPLKIKKPKLKIGKIGKTLGSVAKKATGAIAGKKSAENDSGGNGGDEGSVIRIPPQPDFEEVVRQINEQLHNLSKPQIMEIAKKAKEVITEKNDEEQKLEDELNKL